MSEDRDRLHENEDAEQADDDDVEAHRLAKDPTSDSDDSDDVEAHRLA